MVPGTARFVALRLARLLCTAGIACLVLQPPPARALAMSRGFQALPITYQECLARAYRALVAEGYNAQPSTGASFVNGFKGPHGVYITCGMGPTQQSEINVIVATENTQDGNMPGAERVRLQQRMAQAAVSPPQPPPPPIIFPPPPPPQQAGTWSAWFNRDNQEGSADWEAFPEIGDRVPCPRPVAVECRTVADKRDWRLTGQRYKCSMDEPNPGGICLNSQNPPSGCLDYEVRFFCPSR